MPMIMPKVRRSRLSWMNSLTMIPTHLDQEKLIAASLLPFAFHEMDEHVLQAGLRLGPAEREVVAVGGGDALERRLVLAGDVQRVAERRDVRDAALAVQLGGELGQPA